MSNAEREIQDNSESSGFTMQVSMSKNTRRLPVYLLLDCSDSMEGPAIQAVQNGLELFCREVQEDPQSEMTVHVGVILFSATRLTRMITEGLVPIWDFDPPQLETFGKTDLGKAVTLLNKSIDEHVRTPRRSERIADYRPLVFILTDGEPDPGWEEPIGELRRRQNRKVVDVIVVGCGPNIREENLREIGIGRTFSMNNTEESFRMFFKWVSQSAVAATRFHSSFQHQKEREDDEIPDIPIPSAMVYIR